MPDPIAEPDHDRFCQACSKPLRPGRLATCDPICYRAFVAAMPLEFQNRHWSQVANVRISVT